MCNNMVSKTWVGMSTTNIHLLQSGKTSSLLQLKIQGHLQKKKKKKKHMDFECQYIRTQTEEKLSNISNIT